jgi:hypothetical protein
MAEQFAQEQERLLPEWLANELASSIFSSRIVYHETIDSTNRFAKDLAVAGAPGELSYLQRCKQAGEAGGERPGFHRETRICSFPCF